MDGLYLGCHKIQASMAHGDDTTPVIPGYGRTLGTEDY